MEEQGIQNLARAFMVSKLQHDWCDMIGKKSWSETLRRLEEQGSQVSGERESPTKMSAAEEVCGCAVD